MYSTLKRCCMAFVGVNMEKLSTTVPDMSQVFRTPLAAERQLGLWVDRIGHKRDRGMPDRLRVLGLFGAVHVIDGTGVFESAATGRIDVSAGQTMLLFPEVPHRYGSPDGWESRWVVWGGPRAQLFRKMGYLDPERAVVDDTGHAVTRACDSLSRTLARSDRASCLDRDMLISSLVRELHIRQQSPESRSSAQLVAEAVAVLDAGYTTPIRPGDIAGTLGVSYAHLRRLFKQVTGHSMKEHIIRRRLNHAKSLLADGVRPIKRVAAAVGYDDVLYFMRLFRSHVGVSPGRFS